MKELFFNLVKFKFRLFLVLLVSFVLHCGAHALTGNAVFTKNMLVSYLIAYVLTVFSFLAIQVGKKQKNENLGFYFMWTSFSKLVVYFVLFSLLTIDPAERIYHFVLIVVPYSFSLFIEVYDVVNLLKEEV